MMSKHVKIVIEGITEDGKRFRPSDWIERISGNLSTFGNDRRIRYSRYLQPQILQGQKCLVIDPELRDKSRAAFNYLMDFAKDNKLRVRKIDAATSSQAAKEPLIKSEIPAA